MNKKTLLTIFQFAVTLGLLWWVFHDPAKRREMAEALVLADWRWLWIGVAVFFGCSVLSTFRWLVLLRVQEIRIGWWRLWQLFMIGNFFNLFMLGSTGGDVVKMFLTMREAGDNKTAALLSVFMDRVIGMLALIFLSVTVLYLRYDVLGHTQGSAALVNTLLWLLAAALVIIVGMFVFSALGWVHYLPSWTPLRGRIVELSAACHLYAKGWRLTIWAFLVSFPLFAMFFTTFYCAAQAFAESSSKLGVLDIFSVMPIVAVITAIPISVSGIGVRESLFVSLLAPFGVTAAVATLISVSGFLINLVGSLAGGIVFLFYRSSSEEAINLRDMAREVDRLEDRIEHSE
ncbi:MAG: flippase-like domain-containing protein [Chthoniobacterales bacterium]|nr:flippase-like domain-containing protein [Chthoniobacterales bacterium]